MSPSATATGDDRLALAERLKQNQTYALIRAVLGNPKGAVGAIVVGALVFIAVTAPWIAP